MGGDPQKNAEIAFRILEGEKGPKRDIVILNAAVCLYMSFHHITLRECVKLAADLIDTGKALQKLQSFIRYSNEVAS